jgi:hypothetical protein
MSFGYSASVPICDPAIPHHYNGTNSHLLPHRACNLPLHVSNKGRIPLSAIRDRNSSAPIPTWQSTRRCTEDSPTIGFCNRPQIRQNRLDNFSSRDSRTQKPVSNVTAEAIRPTTNAKRVTFQQPVSGEFGYDVQYNVQSVKPNELKHNTLLSTAKRNRHYRKASASAKLCFNNLDNHEPYNEETAQLSPLNKPLPDPPELYSEVNHTPQTKLQSFAPIYTSSQRSMENTLYCSPKSPTPLRLFPPSPTNSLDAAHLEPLISSPTTSMRPSWYLTPQVSVFEEDDEEKIALIDYLKWPLQGGKNKVRWRLKNLKTRGGRYWKGFFCWPCGGG